ICSISLSIEIGVYLLRMPVRSADPFISSAAGGLKSSVGMRKPRSRSAISILRAKQDPIVKTLVPVGMAKLGVKTGRAIGSIRAEPREGHLAAGCFAVAL